MPRFHPTILVSSLALCALLGCDHKITGDADDLFVEGKKIAPEQPERAGGPVPAASPAAPSEPREAREALIPQARQAPPAGDQRPTGAEPARDAHAAASERVPTSGTATTDQAQDDAVADREGADRGSPSDTCVQGWVRPRAGSKLRKAALDMLRQQRGERFVVLEMRYFVGPEDAEVIGPQRQVERWYVKARSLADRSRQLMDALVDSLAADVSAEVEGGLEAHQVQHNLLRVLQGNAAEHGPPAKPVAGQGVVQVEFVAFYPEGQAPVLQGVAVRRGVRASGCLAAAHRVLPASGFRCCAAGGGFLPIYATAPRSREPVHGFVLGPDQGLTGLPIQ